MSYRYFVNKRNPCASFILDDPVPFFDNSGLLNTGGKKTGTADPGTSTALVAGASYSSVFSSSSIGEFTCPLYRTGLEDRPFALESWFFPIELYSGYTEQTVNTAVNPSAASDATGWSSVTGAESVISRTTAWSVDGNGAIRMTKAVDSTGVVGVYSLGSALNNSRAVTAGQTVKCSATIHNPNATSKDINVAHYWYNSTPTLLSTTSGTATTIPAGDTVTIHYKATAPANTAYALTAFLAANSGTANMTNGDSMDIDQCIITVHNTDTADYPEYFDGSYTGASWNGSSNASYSTMPVSTSPQQVLSHDGQYDGLSIDGTVVSFSTVYDVGGSSECYYDLQGLRAAHVVGVHNKDQNQLWVNGKLVFAIDITDEQKASTYPSWADDKLYCGYTTSSKRLAVNGVAFYNNISADQINQNYQAGIGVIPQAKVATQFDGITLNMSGTGGSKFIDRTWADRSDFNIGLKNNVEYSEDRVTPAYDAGLSVSGTWTASVPLDSFSYASIYGVMVEWSGRDIVVEASNDGTTWTPVVSGELVSFIPNGYDPTGEDFQVRASFAGGLADDPAYLESLTVIAYKDNTFSNITTRAVTVGHPAVLRGDFEPISYRDDNGVSLHGATLTIGADSSTDPDVARTLELWIKPVSGTPTISVSGTNYRNGAADSTTPLGEWQLLHIVAAADVTTDITISGDCIIGQVSIYPIALTADQVLHIYKSYTGVPVSRITDSSSPIDVDEDASPVTLYAHDWSITGAG